MIVFSGSAMAESNVGMITTLSGGGAGLGIDKEMGWPFENMHKDGGVPTAEVSCRFTAPSRHGDVLELKLSIVKPGRSSLDYSTRASCQEEQRFKTHCTLVKVNSDGWPESLPDPARAKLQYFMEGQI